MCKGDKSYGELVKKAPPAGSPLCPKVIVKAAVIAAVVPKVHGTSVEYYEINISDYSVLPWY